MSDEKKEGQKKAAESQEAPEINKILDELKEKAPEASSQAEEVPAKSEGSAPEEKKDAENDKAQDGTPLETLKEVLSKADEIAEEAKEAPTEETQEAPTEETQEAPTEETQDAPAEEAPEVPAEEKKETLAEEPKETQVEEPKEVSIEESSEDILQSPAVKRLDEVIKKHKSLPE